MKYTVVLTYVKHSTVREEYTITTDKDREEVIKNIIKRKYIPSDIRILGRDEEEEIELYDLVSIAYQGEEETEETEILL